MENNNIDNNTVKFLSHIEKTQFLDLKDILANHASRLLLGAGDHFESDKDNLNQFWEKFKKWNNWDLLLNTLVYTLSQRGRQIITINKVNDKIRLLFTDPNYINQIGKFYVDDEIAVLWVTPIKDNKNIKIKEVWDKEKVTRFGLEGEQSITIESINEVLPPEEQIPKVEFHGLGFLPIVEFLNKNLDVNQISRGNNGNLTYEIISDDWPVQNIRRLIDVDLRTQTYETAANVSRVIGALDKSKVDSLTKKGESVFSWVLGRIVLNLSQYGEKGAPNLTYMPANPALSAYTDATKKNMEMYFEGAGYSSPEQAVMDTATQVLYAKSRDVETTNQKRDIITPKLLELIDKVLYMAGLSSDIPENDDMREYSFSIKNNLQISKTEQIANVGEQLRLGLMTKTEAIAELRGVENNEAEVILKEINKEKEENMKSLTAFQEIDADLFASRLGERETDNGNKITGTEDNTENSRE